MASYATVGDLEVRWRPLSEDERARAEVLLADASRRARSVFRTLDARIASGSLDPMTVVDVVAGMVKRAMMVPDVEGVTQQSQTVGPFSLANTYGNPMGNLYLTAEDKALLRDPARSGVRSVRLVADW